MNILLDTNAYTALMSGRPEVTERVRQSEKVLLSSVVAGELLFGFHNGTRFEENYRHLSAFLENPFVELLPVTLNTANRFGRIAAALRSKGNPIPTNDIWIAAHTMESGGDLLSYDQHFSAVDGLAWIHLRA